MSAAREHELLDRTDTLRRTLQHGAVWLGIALLFLAGAVLRKSIEGRAGVIGGVGAALGLAVMASAFAIPGGEGAGDVITATADAGLVKFRCRIVVEPAGVLA